MGAEMDTGHWIMNPLESEDIVVLKRAKRGIFDHRYDRFRIAALVAKACLHFDGELVSITAKGDEAIECFSSV